MGLENLNWLSNSYWKKKSGTGSNESSPDSFNISETPVKMNYTIEGNAVYKKLYKFNISGINSNSDDPSERTKSIDTGLTANQKIISLIGNVKSGLTVPINALTFTSTKDDNYYTSITINEPLTFSSFDGLTVFSCSMNGDYYVIVEYMEESNGRKKSKLFK